MIGGDNGGRTTTKRSCCARSPQNANSILLARQRAEQELIQAKEALERKTEELAHSLSMMRATLESTTDGILVTDAQGNVTDFNEKFVEMWRMPREIMERGNTEQLLEIIGRQFKEPEILRQDRGDLRVVAAGNLRPAGVRRRQSVRAIFENPVRR